MKNVNEMSGPELVAEYNRLTGKSIKKFSTKADGIKAVNKALDAAVIGDEKPAPKKGKVKPAPKKAKKVRDDEPRDGVMITMMRGGHEFTIKQFMAQFNTEYKNITGSLFNIRKTGAGLHAGEKLTSRREGMTTFYTISRTK